MIRLYALVALGGAIGSVGRFWLGGAVARVAGTSFPWGTVLINVLGSFAIGWLAALTITGRVQSAPSMQAFAMVGLCGGFTTFSAFSLQTVELLRAGAIWAAAANIGGSVALCIAATGAGLAWGRQ